MRGRLMASIPLCVIVEAKREAPGMGADNQRGYFASLDRRQVGRVFSRENPFCCAVALAFRQAGKTQKKPVHFEKRLCRPLFGMGEFLADDFTDDLHVRLAIHKNGMPGFHGLRGAPAAMSEIHFVSVEAVRLASPSRPRLSLFSNPF